MSEGTVVVTFMGPGEPVVGHRVWYPGETREIDEGVLVNLVREHGVQAFAVQANADVTPVNTPFVVGEAMPDAAPKGKRK